MAKRKWSQLQSELAMVYGYAMLLAGELRTTCILLLPSPQIPGRRPIIPPHEPAYMPVPLGLLGGWGSFAEALGPSQDLRYTLVVRVLPPAFLQVATTMMMMMTWTSLLEVMILCRVSHLLQHDVTPRGHVFFHVSCRHCPMTGQLCMYIIHCLLIGLDVYVLYCPTMCFDV